MGKIGLIPTAVILVLMALMVLSIYTIATREDPKFNKKAYDERELMRRECKMLGGTFGVEWRGGGHIIYHCTGIGQ